MAKALVNDNPVPDTFVIDQIKIISRIQHIRHRSPANDLVNILAGLVVYTHQPKRPSLHMSPEETLQMELLAEAQMRVAKPNSG